MVMAVVISNSDNADPSSTMTALHHVNRQHDPWTRAVT